MKVKIVFDEQGFMRLLNEFIADNIGEYISVEDDTSSSFTEEDVARAFGVPVDMYVPVRNENHHNLKWTVHYRDAFSGKIGFDESDRRIAVERHHRNGGHVEFTLRAWNVPFWKHTGRPLWQWDRFDYRIAEYCHCDGQFVAIIHDGIHPPYCLDCKKPPMEKQA